jgi:hypothetical protein
VQPPVVGNIVIEVFELDRRHAAVLVLDGQASLLGVFYFF